MAIKEITSSADIKIYENEHNFKIYAGPGAGKTFFLVENIKAIVNNSPKLKIDETRKICCITYTNVAANEIKNRLLEYNAYTWVSTIHSFLFEHIIKPNQVQLKALIKEFFEIDIPNKVKFSSRQEGFSLIVKIDIDQFIGRLLKDGVDISNIIDKKEREVKKKDFDGVTIDLKKVDTTVQGTLKNPFRYSRLFNESNLLKIKKAIWELEGVLDYDEILFFSIMLLKRYRHISYSIRYKFPYLFIDEYQDTVKIQNEILQILGQSKDITIGVIGDLAQSIYGFANADYRDFYNFTLVSKEFDVYSIDDNRRSNQSIVDFLNYVRQKDNAIKKQACIKNEDEKGCVNFIFCTDSNKDIMDLIEKDTYVICRRWADAFLFIRGLSLEQKTMIERIHNYNANLSGRNIFNDFETENFRWIQQVSFIANIENILNTKDFSTIVKECEKIFDLSEMMKPNVGQNNNLPKLRNFLSKMREISSKKTYGEIIKFINLEAANSGLKIKEKFEILVEGDNGFREELHPYLNALEYETLQKMYNEVFTTDSRYITIHRVKGKEFDNVLVSLETFDDDYSDALIDFLENPNLFIDLMDERISKAGEYQRIAYVGFSRAKNNLYVHIRNTKESFKYVEEKFKKFMEENNIKKPFYRLIDLN